MPYGNDSLYSDWIFNRENRNFDVKLLFFHEEIQNQELLANTNSFDLFHLKDYKWWMIYTYLTEVEPEVLTRYDNFFFPDDDLLMDVSDINLLFLLFSETSLMMAQPSLSKDSYRSWDALRSRWYSGLRYVNAVEVMCPMMTKTALSRNLEFFCETKSGWGIDLLWGKVIRSEFGEKSVGVFDTVKVKHVNPVGQGELYHKLQKIPRYELLETLIKYGIEERRIDVLDISENRVFRLLLSRLKFFFRKQIRIDLHSFLMGIWEKNQVQG